MITLDIEEPDEEFEEDEDLKEFGSIGWSQKMQNKYGVFIL